MSPGLQEGILDSQPIKSLPLLKILAVKNAAPAFDCGRYNQSVIPGERVPGCKLEGPKVETKRRLDRQEWPEGGRQVLVCLRQRQRSIKSAKSDIEKFLYNLITDDPLLFRDRQPDQFRGPPCLLRGVPVKRVNEDICVEKEPIAHSSHPACNGAPPGHALDASSKNQIPPRSPIAR